MALRRATSEVSACLCLSALILGRPALRDRYPRKHRFNAQRRVPRRAIDNRSSNVVSGSRRVLMAACPIAGCRVVSGPCSTLSASQPPSGEGGGVTLPVGGDVSRLAAIPISEGFNLGNCNAKPGHGPMMQNHDINETFIPMTDKWRCSWENEHGEMGHVDLLNDPLDDTTSKYDSRQHLETGSQIARPPRLVVTGP